MRQVAQFFKELNDSLFPVKNEEQIKVKPKNLTFGNYDTPDKFKIAKTATAPD